MKWEKSGAVFCVHLIRVCSEWEFFPLSRHKLVKPHEQDNAFQCYDRQHAAIVIIVPYMEREQKERIKIKMDIDIFSFFFVSLFHFNWRWTIVTILVNVINWIIYLKHCAHGHTNITSEINSWALSQHRTHMIIFSFHFTFKTAIASVEPEMLSEND